MTILSAWMGMPLEPDFVRWGKMEYQYTIQELSFVDEKKYIYGQVYLPDDDRKKYPVVILSHGYGVNHLVLTDFAELLAKAGIAAYVFDFCGGGYGCKSSGTVREMSVLTELADLEFVLQSIYDLEFVDNRHIFLCGESQGGFVSALCAAKRKSQLAAIILLYPAFMIPEIARRQYREDEDIPEKVVRLGMVVGKKYFLDARTINAYRQIIGFDKKVLIFHGDKDDLVPLSYSQRAVKVYPDARLIVMEGAEHGFYGEDVVKAAKDIVAFIYEECGADVAGME